MDLFLSYQYFVTTALLVVLINFIINSILFKNAANFLLPDSIKRKNPLASILIPARNEEKNINRCVRSLLKQDYFNIEILVLDDNSSDGTGQVVKQISEKDSRVKLITGKPLKNGWLGKSYACHQLAKRANGAYFVFTDADTLHSRKSISNAINCLTVNNLDALSIYPMQIMVTLHERMIVSFVNFAVLNFLALILLKKSKNPLFCTGMGQFMLFKREIYEKIGGHESVKKEILEDVHISKQVKRCGYKFMIFDGSRDVYCRMYKNFSEVVSGFSKFIFATFNYNIFVQSIVTSLVSALFLFPFILFPLGVLIFAWPKIVMNLIIVQISIILIIKIILALRFKSRILDAVVLHPFSILYLILISINSVFQAKLGRGVYWKGRTYDIKDKDDLKIINNSYK